MLKSAPEEIPGADFYMQKMRKLYLNIHKFCDNIHFDGAVS